MKTAAGWFNSRRPAASRRERTDIVREREYKYIYSICIICDDDVKQWPILSVLIKTIYKSSVCRKLPRVLYSAQQLLRSPRPYTIRGTRHFLSVTHTSPNARNDIYESLSILNGYAYIIFYYVRSIVVVDINIIQ